MTAYSLVTETREELQGYRNSGEDTFADWLEVCKTLGDKVGVYPQGFSYLFKTGTRDQ